MDTDIRVPLPECTQRRGQPRIQGRGAAQEGKGNREEEGRGFNEGQGQGNSKEGRGGSSHPQHDAQASLHGQARNRQDRPPLSGCVGGVLDGLSRVCCHIFRTLMFLFVCVAHRAA